MRHVSLANAVGRGGPHSPGAEHLPQDPAVGGVVVHDQYGCVANNVRAESRSSGRIAGRQGELGGEAEYDLFAEELSRNRMGHILDFVPNHMGIAGSENKWWQDVLENGRCSPYSDFFDIEWNPTKTELKGKILLPILADQYGVVLEQGDLHLDFREGVFFLKYF